ncbi:putative F-box protein PP2-B12 [Lolium perenne]|uniref:putative F-box protein PP2-B12 n=1 Tax=Lolium perenne TaxID=4522 RepID=UPI0021F631F3|nr:putative F-box protein PP2-B12 [Lolium perenne]
METPVACEIERLPEDLLVHVISLTSPADAFRASAVSRAFHAAAESETVWSRFLPSDLPRFAKNELTRKPPSTKKGLFRRLSDEPVLLPHKFVRMQLDKATGTKCFTLSASALEIKHFSHARNWIPVGSDFDNSKRGKRFDQFPSTPSLKVY